MGIGDLAGICGATMLLVAYWLASRGDKRQLLLASMNGMGALLLSISATLSRTWVFVGLNAFWAWIGIKEMLQHQARNSSFKRFYQQEMSARRLLLCDEKGRPLSRLALLERVYAIRMELRAQRIGSQTR